jgi:hypothetical protein
MPQRCERHLVLGREELAERVALRILIGEIENAGGAKMQSGKGPFAKRGPRTARLLSGMLG